MKLREAWTSAGTLEPCKLTRRGLLAWVVGVSMYLSYKKSGWLKQECRLMLWRRV